MSTRAGTHDAKTHLSEYMNRVAYAGERVILERHGKPVAALVSLDDLRRLEELDADQNGDKDEAARQNAFRRQLREAGLVVHWPTGRAVLSDEWAPLEIEGEPLSEQIIRERR